MKIISTLFSHYVYDGLNSVFESVAEKLGLEYFNCDDGQINHNAIRIKRKYYLLGFKKFTCHGEHLTSSSGDVIITRDLFSTMEPFSYWFSKKACFVVEETHSKQKLKRLLYGPLSQTLKKKTAFIAQTPRVRDFLKSFGLKVFFIPPFMKSQFSMEKGEHILFIGRAVPIKHTELVVELAKIMPNEKFVMVSTFGEESILSFLKESANTLPNLEVIDSRIPYEQIQTLYKSSKLVLLPTSADPIGYSIVEALSFAVPVISTPYAGASGFLPKNWIIDSFNAEIWKAKIAQMLNDGKHSRLMAKKAFTDNGLEEGGEYFVQVVGEITEYLQGILAK